MTECDKCGKDHASSFAGMTEEELSAIDLDSLQIPVMALSNLGVLTLEDGPEVGVFLKVLGLSQDGEEFVHTYAFTPAAGMRLVNSVTRCVQQMLEDPTILEEAMKEFASDNTPSYTGQYL